MLVPVTAPLLPNGEMPITNNQILRSQAYLFRINTAMDTAKDAVLGQCSGGPSLIAPSDATSTGFPLLDWLSGVFQGSPAVSAAPTAAQAAMLSLKAPQSNNGGSTGPAAGVAVPSPVVMYSASVPGSQTLNGCPAPASFLGGEACPISDSSAGGVPSPFSGLWTWMQANPGWCAAIAFAGVVVISNRSKVQRRKAR
jgi:hypothetical protein